MCVGAEVADAPRVCAGVEVCRGAETGVAEIVPGSIQPPYDDNTFNNFILLDD